MPVIVTIDPGTPEVGDIPAMPSVTVNERPLLVVPYAPTTTGPVVAPTGTVTPMFSIDQLVGVD